MIDQPKKAFTQVQSAIVTLRRGKSDPKWLEAANKLTNPQVALIAVGLAVAVSENVLNSVF